MLTQEMEVFLNMKGILFKGLRQLRERCEPAAEEGFGGAGTAAKASG
jgi:hypothetical protein